MAAIDKQNVAADAAADDTEEWEFPDLMLKDHALDVTFHPFRKSIAVGLITGEIKVYVCN
jgi:hypothetical protein